MFKKKTFITTIGLLTSLTLMSACSNTSKPSTNTSHSQEKTSSEKTKEVSIGNYINQSKKAPQLWYEIDGEEVIKGNEVIKKAGELLKRQFLKWERSRKL